MPWRTSITGMISMAPLFSPVVYHTSSNGAVRTGMAVVAGLDVGGAHLKVALVEDGRVVAVEQLSCPLWQGMDKLVDALAEARPLLRRAGHHGVTMTGELSDHFRDRKAGVEALVARLAAEFGP